MDWNKAKRLPEKHFRRATGLTPLLFQTLVETINDHLALRKYSGRPPILSVEDQLLLTLMYYREYRTLFMIGVTDEVSEATAWQVIRKIEDSPEFNLIRKERLSLENQETTYLVDATEIAIERPKTDQQIYYSACK